MLFRAEDIQRAIDEIYEGEYPINEFDSQHRPNLLALSYGRFLRHFIILCWAALCLAQPTFLFNDECFLHCFDYFPVWAIMEDA